MKKYSPFFKYSQPDYYHFSDDSIFLSKFIYPLINNRLKNSRLLDLCCGCGVVGLELKKQSKESFFLSFIELQAEFFLHLKKNCNYFFPNNNFEIQICDYRSLKEDHFSSYDFIVCNPPFFYNGKYRLSHNQNRNLCRHFIEGDYDSLIKTIYFLLKKGGEAYILSSEKIEITNNKLQLDLLTRKGLINLYRLIRIE